MSRYIVKLSNITSSQGAGEYDGGHTLEKARREANFFAMHSPGARITINTATRDGRLKLVEVYHEPRSEGLRRDTKHRSRTRTEYVASLGWNIRDAEEGRAPLWIVDRDPIYVGSSGQVAHRRGFGKTPDERKTDAIRRSGLA